MGVGARREGSALYPRPLLDRFLFRSRFSFRTDVTLTLQTTKHTHTLKKKTTATQATCEQSLLDLV